LILKLHSFERLLSYLNDIADVVETADVDEGVFQTYRAVGKSFASELMNIEALKPVGKAFSRGIERLDESWRLSYGQSMEILWSSFDSATAKSLSELDSRLEVEEISDRLDRIGWSSGASIEQLTVLRCSVLSVSESISRSLECNGSLQVGLGSWSIMTATTNTVRRYGIRSINLRRITQRQEIPPAHHTSKQSLKACANTETV